MKTLQNLQLFLLSLFVLTFPLNLFLNLFPHTGYVRGLQIDYLLPKLYLSQIFLNIIFILWFIRSMLSWLLNKPVQNNHLITQLLKNKRKSLITIGYWLIPLTFFFTRSLYTFQPLASLWFTLQTTVTIFFGVWFWKNKTLLLTKVFKMVLTITFTFQLVIGVTQFFTQSALFPYQLLGETQIQRQVGIAKADFTQIDQILSTNLGQRVLAHGTFPHPNVLAGFAVLTGLILLRMYKHPVIKVVILLSTVLILFVTQSFSATLTGILGVAVLTIYPHFSKLKYSRSQQHILVGWIILGMLVLLVPLLMGQLSQLTTQPSITRRNYLNIAAVQLFLDHPLFGVGLNQFTAHIETYATNNEVVAFVQPAHHVLLLLLSEVGIVGILILAIGAWKIFRKQKLSTVYYLLFTAIVLVPLLTLDHYLYTLWQGQVIVVLFIIFWLGRNEKQSRIS